MKKFLFYVAVAGWILGLIVHLLSIADFDIQDKVPFVWFLHVGIFVVWIPIVLYLYNTDELRYYQQSWSLNPMNSFRYDKILFRQTPTWLTVIANGGFFYLFINFLLFISTYQGTANIKDNQYVLYDHAHLIRALTKQEYHHYRAVEIRVFSGGWLAFYGLAAAVLFPFGRQTTNE